METQLFSWESYQEITKNITQYNNCILKMAIGEHPVGTKFACIIMDWGGSLLMVDGDPTAYSLVLKVDYEKLSI